MARKKKNACPGLFFRGSLNVGGVFASHIEQEAICFWATLVYFFAIHFHLGSIFFCKQPVSDRLAKVFFLRAHVYCSSEARTSATACTRFEEKRGFSSKKPHERDQQKKRFPLPPLWCLFFYFEKLSQPWALEADIRRRINGKWCFVKFCLCTELKIVSY